MNHVRAFFSKLWSQRSSILRLIRRGFLLLLTAIIFVFVLLPLAYMMPGWGLGAYVNEKGEVVPSKTLWDWLGLVFVPVFLLMVGVYINAAIQKIERERTEKQAKVEHEIADDRLKEQTLQTYIDRISDLMLKDQFDDPKLGSKASAVARA